MTWRGHPNPAWDEWCQEAVDSGEFATFEAAWAYLEEQYEAHQEDEAEARAEARAEDRLDAEEARAEARGWA